jgi:hypothetical protein
MSDLLSTAAEAMGIPIGLVERAAQARARVEGVSTDDVLRAWAGGGAIEASGEAPAAEAAASAAPQDPPTAAAERAPEPEAAAPEVEVVGGDDEPDADAGPVPEEPDHQSDLEPEEEAVAAGALPRWLVSLFVIVPAFAVAYALFLPNGPNCGDAGRLAVDPVTGVAVNCDGTEYGSVIFDFFAVGAEQYQAAGCVACHGASGGGGGGFPSLQGDALLATFPAGSCDQHIEWVRLGTAGWPEGTYGANEKPVGGSGLLMPGFSQLTPDLLASVVIYERTQFGGLPLDQVIEDCAPAEDDTSALGD